MRFLFEYVTCCFMIEPCNKADPSTHGTITSLKAEDDMRSLVATASSRSCRLRKRTPTRGTSSDWQPSLFAISEDNAVAATPAKAPTVKQPHSQRNVKRRVVSSDHSRSYDFCFDPIPMAVPAFSAAPFMF